jgi:hypothetical protein
MSERLVIGAEEYQSSPAIELKYLPLQTGHEAIRPRGLQPSPTQ